MNEKKCTRCNLTKPITEFGKRTSSKDGLHPNCKTCRKILCQDYREKNLAKCLESSRRSRIKNAAKIKEYRKKRRETLRAECLTYEANYRANNAEKIKQHKEKYTEKQREKNQNLIVAPFSKQCSACKETLSSSDFHRKATAKDGHSDACKKCASNRALAWAKNNPEKVRANNDKWAANNVEKVRTYRNQFAKAYSKARSQKDPQYKLARNLRSRLSAFIKRNKASKPCGTMEMLDCSLEFLRSYLEAKFVTGMTWENYGTTWHIDHIFPLSKANLLDPEQLKKVNHYTNLQPLFVTENLKKGNRIL